MKECSFRETPFLERILGLKTRSIAKWSATSIALVPGASFYPLQLQEPDQKVNGPLPSPHFPVLVDKFLWCEGVDVTSLPMLYFYYRVKWSGEVSSLVTTVLTFTTRTLLHCSEPQYSISDMSISLEQILPKNYYTCENDSQKVTSPTVRILTSSRLWMW